MAPFAKLLSMLAILVLIASGCAGLGQLQHYGAQATIQRKVQTDTQTIMNECNAKKRNEPGLDPMLGSKTPLYDIRDMTVAMMVSTEKPTDAERKMLLRGLEITLACQKEALAMLRGYPQLSPYATVLDAAYNHGIGLGLELYHGRFTYGEYNLKKKEAYTDLMRVLAQVDAELAKQSAEAMARAQQLAFEQQQLFLNYLNNYNNYMSQQQQQQHGMITCTKMGVFTNCHY